MRHGTITDVDYSYMWRAFDNYERNIGKRNPLEPNVDSAGRRRTFYNETLFNEHSADEGNFFHGIIS